MSTPTPTEMPDAKEMAIVYAIASFAERVAEELICNGRPQPSTFMGLCHALTEWEIAFPQWTISERQDEIDPGDLQHGAYGKRPNPHGSHCPRP